MMSRAKLIKQGLWFSFFNSILLLLIATRYFQYFHEVNGFLTIFYLTIATLSHFITLSFLAYLILYTPVILVFPYKAFAWIWAAVISIVSTIILIIDTFVYQLYRFHINGFVLELLFGGAGDQIFEFHLKQYLLVISTLLVLLVIVFGIAYVVYRSSILLKLKHGLWLVILVICMMASSHFIHAWADAANYTAITKSSRNFPLYFPTTAKTFMVDIGLVDSTTISNSRIEDASHSGSDLNYPKNPLQFGEKEEKDIIMILIDSWHYSTLNQENMPNLYEFSQQCEVYKNHYSGSNGTRTGVFSLFYSIPGVYWDAARASQTSSILVDGLLINDYQIKTFASASLASPPFDRTVFKKVKDLNIKTKGKNASTRDQQITNDWLSMVHKLDNDTLRSPSFSFLFYDALHAISHPKNFKGPYQPAWEYAKYELLNNELDPMPFFNLYKNTAYYVDSLVGRVLDDLKNSGKLANSIIIISGDHGQEFNDNKKNYWGHNGNYSAAQLQVPLLIYKPDVEHEIYTHWTSHYDIVPSIFEDIFACENKISDYSIGKHLNDASQRNWLLVGSKDNFGIVQPDRITSVYFDGTFDITDEKLNKIDNATLDTKLINEVLTSSSTFYRK